MSDDGNKTTDEKPAATNALASKSQEELIRLVKTLILQKRKLDTNISELKNEISELKISNASFCQTAEQARNELEDEQEKSKNLILQLDQYKTKESKLQQELTMAKESLECLTLQNDSLKSLYKNQQDEFENLQKENDELNQKIQNQTTESDGKIQNLKEKLQKMTALLARMKKELQEIDNLEL